MDKKEYRKQYYKKNREKIDAKNRLWVLNHPKKVKFFNKRFYQTPSGIYSTIKSNCRTKNKSFDLERDVFIDWYEKQEKVCCYCGVDEKILPPEFQKLSVSRSGTVGRLTIDRKDNSLGYLIQNLVLACAQCNRMKGEFLSYEEMLEVGKVIRKKWETL